MDAVECDKSMKSLILNKAFLNDLLECPVCLEKLESSSKVLPCQHTFCKRCLHEILNIHKNLRCPVCRASVDANIEELPCNVLLVRLLEAIKNSVQPKKVRVPTNGQNINSTSNMMETEERLEDENRPETRIMWPKGKFSLLNDEQNLVIDLSSKGSCIVSSTYFYKDASLRYEVIEGEVPENITLGQFKSLLSKYNRYFFTTVREDNIFTEEVTEDSQVLPLFQGQLHCCIRSPSFFRYEF